MVHRKSTYRLTYKNYKPDVRKLVYEENNALRLRRQQEERSHVSIEEEESDCDCDSEEEDNEQYESKGQSRQTFSTIVPSNIRHDKNKENTTHLRLRHKDPTGERRTASTPIPRLYFSPENTPRSLHVNVNGITEEQINHPQYNIVDRDDYNVSHGSNKRTGEEPRASQGPQLDDTQSNHASQHTRTKVITNDGPSDKYSQVSKTRTQVAGQDTMTTKERLGVMRPRIGVREYDLIPATKEEPEVCQHNSCSIHKPKHSLDKHGRQTMTKSQRYPYTTHLSKTTKKNFIEHEKKPNPFVSSGSGCEMVDKSFGNKSYNISLNKDQVLPSALKASELRNQEIEKIINKQRKVRIEDWRQKNVIPTVINHSSLWADSKQQLFSKRMGPRNREVRTLPEGVKACPNLCRHCGLRK